MSDLRRMSPSEWGRPRPGPDPETNEAFRRLTEERDREEAQRQVEGEYRDPFEPNLFRRWTMKELLDAPRSFEWLVRGMFISPTYSMTAGELKTLKTYLSIFTNVAVAAGTDIFGHFVVDRPRPVVVYVGEGGRIPYTNRLERVARAMGVELADLPIYPSFDVAPLGSERFVESLARDLAEVEPGLVTIDPYYAFHGAKTESSNLFQEGWLLSSLSARCVDAGACLDIVNHFNQTGVGKGLKRITMAGGGEWVDTWRLLNHRADPKVEEGSFRLLLEIGSRQWGGSRWDLDLEVGRFNHDNGEFEGEITWGFRRHVPGAGEAEEDRAAKVVAKVGEYPGELIREELAKAIGGNLKTARTEVDRAVDNSLIKPVLASRTGLDGKTRKAWVYQLTSNPGREQTGVEEWDTF